jgi:hypothetical protein
MQTPLKAFGGTKRDSVPPTSKVEKTASPMQAAALVPTHCSRPALHAVPPRHREAARDMPGMKEALARGVGLGRTLAEALAEGLCVEEAVGGLQDPPTQAMPLMQPAGTERVAHLMLPSLPAPSTAPTAHWARTWPWQASFSGLHAVPGEHRTAANGVLVQFTGIELALRAGQARAASHVVQAGAGPMLRSSAVP